MTDREIEEAYRKAMRIARKTPFGRHPTMMDRAVDVATREVLRRTSTPQKEGWQKYLMFNVRRAVAMECRRWFDRHIQKEWDMLAERREAERHRPGLDPSVEAETNELKAKLPIWLMALKPVERQTITLHYGLESGTPMTMADITRTTGLAWESVRRYIDRGLRKMEAMSRGIQPV